MKWTKDAVQEEINKIYASKTPTPCTVIAERLADLATQIQVDMQRRIDDLERQLADLPFDADARRRIEAPVFDLMTVGALQ